MLTPYRSRHFANGSVYALKTPDGFTLETTDTFLPDYTKNCINGTNCILNSDFGSRLDRWMIGVSVMSGCPVGCKFCATGNMTKWKNLQADEIIEQIIFILEENRQYDFGKSKEHKINYTRMGEPFLNISNVRKVIEEVQMCFPNAHQYVSTIGVKGSDFSWIKGNITLQLSLHSLDEDRRNQLIPYKNKMSIKELGQIRTNSNLKTTVNLTLVDNLDFDIEKLQEYFDPQYFFIKLSPINTNDVSEKNNLGGGIINGNNC